ncbi:hypothetical protein JH06_2044 [Blastocystis sp. subtype 4]|uniref:hypothetical protein n=1 Tax=Blastocystis sp. subtype 4 TaxID=944170 RepID=UPI000711C173|nr:hypothetical protein JH06_2044 [Blastocystis sp. subtype 4]KNB46044.1 hypothetical protein JH06_2044 [Blastocystis sp. subtype 4]|eukprot:XP_014529487.1 hypothetical protein JH06_2044 [Blastocystis sp. subtype 4]
MQYEAPQNALPQRVAIHRFISLKDYGIMAAVTLISLPLGWYFGRGNGRFIQRATMYTTGLLGLAGGYSMALVNARKRALGE